MYILFSVISLFFQCANPTARGTASATRPTSGVSVIHSGCPTSSRLTSVHRRPTVVRRARPVIIIITAVLITSDYESSCLGSSLEWVPIYFKFQIRFCGPILWNCIHQFHPTLIVGSHSWQSFKKHYKSELLAKYEVI